jgi:hypothetical protein
MESAAALPVPRPPRPHATPSPSPIPATATTLPFGSELLFVLDDTLSSSASKAGDVVHMHLKEPLLLRGKVIAPAGSAASLLVVDSSAAQILDTYGFIDIFVQPMKLPDGREVPLGVAQTRLRPRDTSGHESTVAIEDTIADIVIPYAGLFQIFRKGRNFVLHPGAELRAHLDATLTATPRGIAIETPRPFSAPLETPHPAFQALPLAQPMPSAPPPPTVAPPPETPSPVPSPTPSPSPRE